MSHINFHDALEAPEICLASDCKTSWPVDTDTNTGTTNAHLHDLNNNITGFPTCSGTDKLTSSGTTISCATDQTEGTNPTYQWSDAYYRKYYHVEAGFESVTAAYNAPWVPTAVGSGTTGLIAGTYNHPGTAQVSTSTTASSGYCYQITGATTYLLGADYTTQASFKPITRTGQVGETRIRFGFQDVFTLAGPVVDGVWFNITQLNTTHFHLHGEARANSNNLQTPTDINIPTGIWYGWEIYIRNTTLAEFTLYNETTMLWQSNVTGTLPVVAGRETSHAFCAFVNGTTAAGQIAQIDYQSIGINRTINR